MKCVRRLVSVLCCILASTSVSNSFAAAIGEMVGPLKNVAPKQSKSHDPSALDLVETWLGGSDWPPDHRFDHERYQVLNYHVTWNQNGRAILAFRLLPLKGETLEDAIALASRRCAGRKVPIDVQIYYEWSAYSNSWVALDSRGDPGFETCPQPTKFWTINQMARLVDPPPLPLPPKVSQKDVVTPRPGTPEREAILDAVRPIYEGMFGKPIALKVETMRLAAGFSFLAVHPQRPDGSPISKLLWNKAHPDRGANCANSQGPGTDEYWMKLVDGAWRPVLSKDYCADDSIVDEGDIVGAPPQIDNKVEWAKRTTYPVDAIDAGIIH